MKKLTRRQQEFLGKLLDLYHQEGESIHYSVLAKSLGVGKVTAYEMLRLLEDRGLVHSEFQRPEDRIGPGRSTVVFRPTALAASTFSDLAGGGWDEDEWEQAKHRVLEQLRAGKVGGYETLLNDLLARLPGQRSPIIYLAEMITAIVLGLHSLKDVAEAHSLMRILRNLGLPGEVGLSALAGFGASLSLVERVNRQVATVLLKQTKKYQTVLSEMSAENQRRLAEFTREVVKIVGL
jgi:DNA-binding MarR family transcriptional regulator